MNHNDFFLDYEEDLLLIYYFNFMLKIYENIFLEFIHICKYLHLNPINLLKFIILLNLLKNFSLKFYFISIIIIAKHLQIMFQIE